MEICLTSMMEIKSHGAMEIGWMSNGDLSDFHDGSKIPWSYGGFMDF